jgi:hypothetical protein
MTLELLDQVGRIGAAGMLIAALIGGFRRWWVWGWQYQEMRDDRDQWRDIAIKGMTVAQGATTIATRGTDG